MGGSRHCSLLLLEIENKIHRLGGCFFLWFKGVFKVKKGTPKELRGVCLLFVTLLLSLHHKTRGTKLAQRTIALLVTDCILFSPLSSMDNILSDVPSHSD